MNVSEVIKFTAGHHRRVSNRSGQLVVEIVTLEGIMVAEEGDYIIKGVEGEFYPCKPNIFDKTYDILEGEDI